MKRPVVLGITGASGAIYSVRLLDVLLAADQEIYLAASGSGRQVILQELGWSLPADFDVSSIFEQPLPFGMSWMSRPQQREQIRVVRCDDFMSAIASGSFLTQGMVVCPCSGATLSGIVHGSSQNVIHRAAEVHLKERRKLVLVPRETPLSRVYLENLRKADEAGAVVLPAMPGWYHGVAQISDLVDFVVARICDQLDITHQLMKRWGEEDGCSG